MSVVEFMPNKEYVSFDMFDTLVRRLVFEPHQIFYITEEIAKKNGIDIPDNFVALRIEAERVANRELGYANIYDIYNKIREMDNETRKAVLEIEIATEIDLCVPNPEVVEMYRRCVEDKKKIFVISDMYLPVETLEKILTNCEISDYEKIYVSCDCKASKQDGKLFQYVLKEIGIKPGQLFHIGDNLKGDVLIPKKLGIHSRHYKKTKLELPNIDRWKTVVPKIDWGTENSTVSCNLSAFYQNMFQVKYSDRVHDIPFQIGYMGLGSLLLGFTKWLEKCFIEDGIEKVFFLSRDGRIMQSAYKVIHGSIDNTYLYASRRALIVPSLAEHAESSKVFTRFFTAKGDTAGSLISKLGLEPEDYVQKLANFGLAVDDRIGTENIEDTQFSQFYQSIQNDVIQNSKEQGELLEQYLDEVDFTGNVAIVDIGWYGNMQRALSEIVKKNGRNAHIKGYYLGVIPNSAAVRESNIDVKGYLFEEGRCNLFKYEKSINAILEWFFSTDHGTVLGYEKNLDGKIVPMLGRYEFSGKMMAKTSVSPMIHNEQDTLEIIQSSALQFLNDVLNHQSFFNQSFKPEDCFGALMSIGMKPTKEEVSYIGDLRFVSGDGKHHYIARPYPIWKYMIDHDARESFHYIGWRVGIFKRIVGLPLPYAKMYFGIRKIAHKKN